MKHIFQFIFVLISIAIYACVWVSPDTFWLAHFICYTIPFLVLLHFIIIALGIWGGVRNVWGSLVSLIIAFPLLRATVAVSLPDGGVPSIHILSYNVNGFNVVEGGKNGSQNQDFVEWAIDHTAPIKVFQEFYTHTRYPATDTYLAFEKAGYYGYLEALKSDNLGHKSGLAIFSKYPIINKGKLLRENSSLNNIIFADIVVDQDTIRIYNFHLQSMGIDPLHVVEAEQLKENYGLLGRQLNRGAIKRTQQIKESWGHIANSPYPAILAGDFNDTPYSHTYWAFRSKFKNAFEAKGTGLGFTMNNKLFFLRIDNVFYGEHLKAKSFGTLNEVGYSDHYPIEASFEFERRK